MRFGRVLFVAWWFLQAAVAYAADDRTARRSVKVRSGPAVFHAVLERLESGAKLCVVEEGKRWIKVRTGTGTEGWVSARVFTERPKAKGYSAVLSERGLAGVSSAVSTMATKGLTVHMGMGGTTISPLVAQFLDRVPFVPEEFEAFVADLPPNAICEKLPGWMDEMSKPLSGDPERDEQERQLGMRLAGLVLQDAELITDPELDAYVNKVGMAVAAASSRYELSWRFVVFESKQAEAFSAPGGFVFVSDGLLKQLKDESELAGLLAHQVAHVCLGHGAAELDRAMGTDVKGGQPEALMEQLVLKAHSLLRAARPGVAEREADAFGATYAACAGYDPAGLAQVYRRVGAPEAAGADTPTIETRAALIDKVRKASGVTPGKNFPGRFKKTVLSQAR